jgi:hypothetical protein
MQCLITDSQDGDTSTTQAINLADFAVYFFCRLFGKLKWPN